MLGGSSLWGSRLLVFSRRLWLSHYVNREKVRWKPKIFNIKFPQLPLKMGNHI